MKKKLEILEETIIVLIIVILKFCNFFWKIREKKISYATNYIFRTFGKKEMEKKMEILAETIIVLVIVPGSGRPRIRPCRGRCTC